MDKKAYLCLQCNMNNTVLITGASTGIGSEIAMTLAKEGYVVFAGVRRKADKIRIEKISKNIHGVYLDVTDPESIDKAFWYVHKKADGLDAIINNAGIGVFGPLEYLPVEKIKEEFDINTFGALAVTQKFLQLMPKGKIINMSSISSCGIIPFMSTYGASKATLDILFNNLLIELNNPDIKVVSIKPGPIKTPIWDKSIKNSEDYHKYLPPSALNKYKKEMNILLNQATTNAQTAAGAHKVANLTLKILKSKNPKLSYTLTLKDSLLMLCAKLPLGFINFVVRKALNFRIKTYKNHT